MDFYIQVKVIHKIEVFCNFCYILRNVIDLIDDVPSTNVPIIFVPSGNTTDSNELSELKASSSTVSID